MTDKTRENCRWGRTSCPFPVLCKEEEGIRCEHWCQRKEPVTITKAPGLPGERDCCGTLDGSPHRITCPYSKHRNAIWRDREPPPRKTP